LLQCGEIPEANAENPSKRRSETAQAGGNALILL
jgi:hypothetical protein